MKEIQIGDKPLMSISEEHLRQIVIIEGCNPSPLYWHAPVVTEIDNTMFSDTVVLDYYCIRIEDDLKSSDYTFFLNTENFTRHYSKDLPNEILRKSTDGQMLSIKSLSFLIKCGYNIPL